MSSEKFALGKITLTKIFTFDMAHALEGYPGKCRHIHGHTYVLHVTVYGPIIDKKNHPYDGMIIDFGILKQWVHEQVIDEYDHALVLRKGSEMAAMPFPDRPTARIVLSDYQPTCENLLADICRRLNASTPSGLKLVRLRLYETPTSYAEWEAFN